MDDGTRTRLRRLGDYLAVFEAPGFEFGRWVTPPVGKDGVIYMGGYSLSPDASRFVRDAYDLDWVTEFDWPSWIGTAEATEFVDDPKRVERATPDELAKLLTVYIRQDRFVDGELANAFESGRLTALLRRAVALAGDGGVERTLGTWAERPWGTPWQSDEALIAAAGEITEIGLARGMCYGPCPVYGLKLRRSGDARFDGVHFVDLMGKHRARISREAFSDLALAALYVGFESLDENYAVRYTDAATTTTWIVRAGQRHQVEDYGGAGPGHLYELEELIDEAASELDWRPIGAPPPESEGPLFVGLEVNESWRPPDVGDPGAHWTQRGGRPAYLPASPAMSPSTGARRRGKA